MITLNADGLDQIFRPQELDELAVVDLGDENVLEPVQDLAEVARERIQVAQVCMGHGQPACTRGCSPRS